MESTKRNQIVEGVIWKQLLLFFFPIVLGTFFQQFYNTIDAVVVGRFVGTNALAAVGGSAGQIQNLVIGFFTGLTSGASVIVSQFLGSRDQERVNEGIHTIYAFSILGSLIVMILGLWLSPTILEMMNTPAELMAESILYLRIYFAGIFFIFIYNSGSSILRALGDSKRPLYYLIICSGINIILDLVMVMIFHMGVAGVAVATLAAQAVSSLLVTRALMKSTHLCHFSIKKIRFHKQMLRAQLGIGLPGGLQSTMYNLSNIIVQAALNIFGTSTAAAWAAYGKMDAIFWMISGSFGIAITTFVGQNYGAGKIHRVHKSVLVCTAMDIAASIGMTLILFIFRVPLFRIFTTDAAVVQIGVDMLEVIAPCYTIFVFIEILSGALRGMSDVLIPMLMTMFGVCLLRIAWIIFIVPLNPTISWTIMNYPVTWIFTAILFIVYYLYRIRRMKK
ncbi:MAG: MATE family efflux transporter [Clostridia bacterium]|nr:MATE family efflux transporter [Lachnospiraceae bacterium]NCC01661.1 MATE family efflux transporter [Clostridia bacterium]NCD03554.1 MATE family efflux transporter [Clostridia bacterium]